jgi:hypothetical protein
MTINLIDQTGLLGQIEDKLKVKGKKKMISPSLHPGTSLVLLLLPVTISMPQLRSY